jgi:hypothetical protein
VRDQALEYHHDYMFTVANGSAPDITCTSRCKSMKIQFACRCGRSFRADESMSGKLARCPKCRAVLNIPRLDEFNAIEVDPSDPPDLIRRGFDTFSVSSSDDGVTAKPTPLPPEHLPQNDTDSTDRRHSGPPIQQVVSVSGIASQSSNPVGIAAMVLGFIAILFSWVRYSDR